MKVPVPESMGLLPRKLSNSKATHPTANDLIPDPVATQALEGVIGASDAIAIRKVTQGLTTERITDRQVFFRVFWFQVSPWFSMDGGPTTIVNCMLLLWKVRRPSACFTNVGGAVS